MTWRAISDTPIACHVIQRVLNPRIFSYMIPMTWRAISVRPYILAPTNAAFKRLVARVQSARLVRTDGYCSPRHRKSFQSRKEGSKCVGL